MDYLDLGTSELGPTKLPVITDRLTKLTRLEPARSESAESASSGLVKWIATLGRPSGLLSDESPAFKNEVIDA